MYSTIENAVQLTSVCAAHCAKVTSTRVLTRATLHLSMQAFISPSTWVGYYNYLEGDTPDENNLYMAPCVSHICGIADFQELPPTASNADIESVVCAKNRQGILCAKCTANNSAYYHSPDFTEVSSWYCSVLIELRI